MTPSSSDLPIEINCQSVKQMLDDQADFLLVDCREQEEYAIANLPQALFIPMSQITSRVGELEPHREGRIVVHCHHGARSLRVAAWLRQNGFAAVQSMAGGIHAWAEQIDRTLATY